MSDIEDEHMSAHGHELDQHDSRLSDEHRDNPPHLSPSSRTSSQGMKQPLGTNTALASTIGHGSEQDMAPTEIRQRTEGCLALLKKLRNQPEFRIHHGRWVELMSFQFLWWSLETDATKCGHSSLDYRVQNRIDLRIDLRMHLQSLEISLKQCIKIAKEMQEASTTQRETEPELEGRAPANTTTTDSSDRDAEIETTTQLERAPELEGRDTANTTTTHSSNRDAEIKLQKDWVEIALQYIARISEDIKSSGIKFSHERVDKLLKQREAELEEFRTHLLYLIPLGPDDMDPTRFVDLKRLTVVQARLIYANLVRRNRFQVYFSRYSRLMGEKKSEDGKTEKQNPVAEPSKISQPAAVSRSSKDTGDLPDLPKELPQPTSGIHYFPMSSQADPAISALAVPDRPQTQGTASISTKPYNGVMQQHYPSCPAPKGNDLWCPLCAQPLDVSYAQPDLWRCHLTEDLSPYVCIYPDCNTPDDMYDTTWDWKEHMKKNHGNTVWACATCWSPDSNDYEYRSKEEWEDHMFSAHKGDFERKHLAHLAKVDEKIRLPHVKCPLCCGDKPLLDPETNKHLAEHLESFSLEALPWDLI